MEKYFETSLPFNFDQKKSFEYFNENNWIKIVEWKCFEISYHLMKLIQEKCFGSFSF